MHGPKTVGELATYGSMGLVLGLIYLKSKRLETNICVHAIWNFLMFLVMLSQK
ncbi:MAG: CPBP family intramembrane metalloprotease [Lactobacillales bacterium]|nr:CPBP family intramembrane metalloprotease [Lactobacillales bacterium]